MKTFVYHRLSPAKPYGLASPRNRVPKESSEIFDIPVSTTIQAEGILEADAKFEELTGVNPVRYKGHTPPITCSISEPSVGRGTEEHLVDQVPENAAVFQQREREQP